MDDCVRDTVIPFSGAASAERLSQRRWFGRRLWLNIHLYLGLILGVLLSVIALSGSFLVFWQEIDELLDPAGATVTAPREGERTFRPLADIAAALAASMPAGAKPAELLAPIGEDGVYKLYYIIPGQGDVKRLFIDPYTAESRRDSLYRSGRSAFDGSFMGFMFDLHWSLLLGDGGITVGILAILVLISLVTGLVLWWPKPGKWITGFTLKRRASAERLTYDLHKLGGVYGWIVLAAVLVSGISMNLAPQFIWVVERFSPVSPAVRHEIQSEPVAGRPPIRLDAAAAAAAARYPEGRLFTIGIPMTDNGAYRVCRNGIESLGHFIDTRCVVIDQYSGRILGVEDPATGTGGDLFMQWQWPLHSGRAFGLTGRLLVFATGLVCPLLFTTGLIRWLQKRRARRVTHRRTGLR
jgi:uncharacterized iron-regulated membrane protein